MLSVVHCTHLTIRFAHFTRLFYTALKVELDALDLMSAIWNAVSDVTHVRRQRVVDKFQLKRSITTTRYNGMGTSVGGAHLHRVVSNGQ